MDYSDLPGFVLPLVAAMLAGGLIGFEREWRGRPAGLRTHILVSLASALLMDAAVMQEHWRFEPIAGTEIVADPARLAHGILTGIGFLCAGVIFRSGFSVHGLTTAASLWVTAAIGLLFGAGLYGLAAVGTALTVTVLFGLRMVTAIFPERTVVDASVSWRTTTPGVETDIESAMVAFNRSRVADRYELGEDGQVMRLSVRLSNIAPHQVEALARRLGALPGVVAYALTPRQD